MSLKELLDKIVEASEELAHQSIDYAKAYQLISVLDKLIECYNNKCHEASDQELDEACWYIIYTRARAYSKKTVDILSDAYCYTVDAMHQRVMNSELKETDETITL